MKFEEDIQFVRNQHSRINRLQLGVFSLASFKTKLLVNPNGSLFLGVTSLIPRECIHENFYDHEPIDPLEAGDKILLLRGKVETMMKQESEQEEMKQRWNQLLV